MYVSLTRINIIVWRMYCNPVWRVCMCAVRLLCRRRGGVLWRGGVWRRIYSRRIVSLAVAMAGAGVSNSGCGGCLSANMAWRRGFGVAAAAAWRHPSISMTWPCSLLWRHRRNGGNGVFWRPSCGVSIRMCAGCVYCGGVACGI